MVALMPTTGFGARLRALREAAGLTQAQLAGRAHLNEFGIANLEQGKREPAWQTVLALSKVLGITPDAFLTEGDLERALEGGTTKPPVRRPGRPPKRTAAEERAQQPPPARPPAKRKRKRGGASTRR